MDEAALIGFSRELSRVLGGWVACMALERGILELRCAVADEDDEEDDGDDDDDDDDDTTELKFVATSSHGNVFMAV